MTTSAATPALSNARSSWERAAFFFVLFVWLEALVSTHVFIATCASPTPAADDTTLYILDAAQPPLLEWAWGLHNEHRLPLPTLTQLLCYRLSGDVRSGMYAEAWIYAATALACILMARKLRGGSRPWDAFFPLLWLQLGNAENLLMGFQLCIAIPTACVCTVFFAAALSPARFRPSRALLAGLALLALPLCGGGGMLYTPPLAALLAWLGWSRRASTRPGERTAARIYLVFVALTVATCGLYMIGYEQPSTAAYDPHGIPVWKRALCMLTAPFGPDGWRAWPASGLIVACSAAVVSWGLVRAALRARLRDPVSLGTLAVLVGGVLLAVGIAIGRPTGNELLVANRYIPLPAPFYVALALGALAAFGPRLCELVLGACCLAMVLATPGSVREGLWMGGMRRESSQTLDRLVRKHAEPGLILQQYSRNFLLGMYDTSAFYLQHFAQHGLPPFDHDDFYVAKTIIPLPIESPTLRVEAVRPPINRELDGEVVSCVAPDTSFVFLCSQEQRSISGVFGAPPAVVERGWFPAVRARAFLRSDEGVERPLGERELDPVRRPEDRGMQRFEFTWEGGLACTLVLRIEAVDPNAEKLENTWVKLRNVRIE